jgi:hypothetical protein
VGVLFYTLYHKLDGKEDEMNLLDVKAGDLANKRALESMEPHGTASGNDYGVEKSTA